LNVGRLLILSSLIFGCGPSIYEKAAAKRAPRDCVAIASERRADNERCALEGNPFKFTGALFRLDGTHRVLNEMTLTFELREAFSDGGTIDFDVTITDPGGREHRAAAVFSSQQTCSPDGDVCFGQHHRYFKLPVRWPASPFVGPDGAGVPGEYQLSITSRHGYLSAEPISLTALSSAAVTLESQSVGSTEAEARAGAECGPLFTPAATASVEVPHDYYLRQLRGLQVVYTLSRAESCDNGIRLDLEGTLTDPDGESYRSETRFECRPDCTPDGIGSQCRPSFVRAIDMTFAWHRSPFLRPDGSAKEGRYELRVSTKDDEECRSSRLVLRAQRSLDVIPTRAVPRWRGGTY
jgi:hypothetical protein